MKRLPTSKTSLCDDLRALRRMASRANELALLGDWESYCDALLEIESLASASRSAAAENIGAER
jgi:hypothetical protein